MKRVRGLWVGNGETWDNARNDMIKFIIFQLSDVYQPGSGVAKMAEKGLRRMSAEQLTTLNLMIYTAK